MKFPIDIDCTPEEARAFLGLPDVQPAQTAMMAVIQERMEEMMRSASPEELMKTWMPTGIQGMESLQ